MHFSFPTKLLLAAALAVPAVAPAQIQLTPQQLLGKAKESIASMNGNFKGWLIVGIGSKKVPFVLQTTSNGVMKYHFSNPKELVQVQIGRASGANSTLTRKLRGTDVTLEDLTVHQLSWSVTNVREARTGGTQCYVVTVRNSTGRGAYTHADVWIQRNALALMRLDAYDRAGLAKKLEVQSIRKVGDQRIASKMRVSTYRGGRRKSSTSIHLDGS